MILLLGTDFYWFYFAFELAYFVGGGATIPAEVSILANAADNNNSCSGKEMADRV